MQSTWRRDVKKPRFPQLKSSVETDIVIIGAGITGITCAYLLSKAGKKVVLLDKKSLCAGATGDTTAFLTQSVDTDLTKLIKMYGKSKTSLISESHQNAIDLIEQVIKENEIECGFKRCSNYIYSPDEESVEYLKEEEETAKSLGINIKFRKDKSLKFKNEGYLEVPDQAKFHPLKYLFSLAKISQKNGARIFEKTEVTEIKGTGPFTIITEKGSVKAKYIIVATYNPFNGKISFKKAFYNSYVFELQIPKNTLKEGLYEDTLNPYHYFRVDRKKDFDNVMIGGEDHRSDIPVAESKSFWALESYIRKTFPNIRYKIISKWKGSILESVDGLAFIGTYKEKNIFYATGFSGNGITYSMIASQIIANSILGKKHKMLRFSSLYSAERSPTLKQLFLKAPDYIQEFFSGALKNTLRIS